MLEYIPAILLFLIAVSAIVTGLYFQFRKQRTVVIPNPIPVEGFRMPVRPSNVKNVYFTKLMLYEDRLEHLLYPQMSISIGRRYNVIPYGEMELVKKGAFGGIVIIRKPSGGAVSNFLNRLFNLSIRLGNKQNLGEIIRFFARKNVPMSPEIETLGRTL